MSTTDPAAPTQTSVAASAPVPVRASINDALNIFLSQTGNNLDEVKADVDAFLNRIMPTIDAQTVRMVTDPSIAVTNLRYLWGMVYAETARVSLGVIYRERAAVTAAVIGVVRGALITAVTA